MFQRIYDIDVWLNHKVLAGRPDETISRNTGRRLGRALGTDTETGTDLFHAGLFTALALGVLGWALAKGARKG